MNKIILPFPPASNNLFPTGKNNRRFKSKRYKAWLAICPEITDIKFEGMVTVSYLIYFPNDRICDGQSYMKAPLDYIVAQGVLKDDNRRIVKGEQWMDGGIDKKNPRVEMMIRRFDGV